jgi:hypothetical protein
MPDHVHRRDGLLKRLGRFGERLPFSGHVAIGCLILIALMQFINSEGHWTSDEGAVRAQVSFLAEDGYWSRQRPFAEIDPEAVLSPINAATIDMDSYYPYTKRPAYPTLLVPIGSLFGRPLDVVPSLVGVIAAAVIGVHIGALVGDGLRRTTFWVLAFATPLFVYGFMVTAHTLASAFAAAAVLSALSSDRRVVMRMAMAMASIALAVSFRVEGVLFGVALAIGLFVLARRTRNRSYLAFSIGIGLATIAAHFGNRMWAFGVGGGAEPVSGAEGVLNGIRLVRGAASSLILLGFESPATFFAIAMMSGGAVLLALTLIREPENTRLQRAFIAISIAGVAVLMFVAPVALSGLLAATPVVVVGIAVLRRKDTDRSNIWVILVVSTIFVFAVFATQDSAGGGIQWGGRYLMLAVPVFVPVAVHAINRVVSGNASGGPLLLLVIVIVSLALSINAVMFLRERHQVSAAFNEQILELASEVAADGEEHPVIVSRSTHLGRHAWRTVEDIDYLLLDSIQFKPYLRRFAAHQPSRFGFAGTLESGDIAFFESIGYSALQHPDVQPGLQFWVFDRTVP